MKCVELFDPSALSSNLRTQVIQSDKNPELIKLALSTLGSFDFSGKPSQFYARHIPSKTLGHVLNEFVRSCALPYLEEDNAEIRRAAAVTCCRLFVRDPIFYSASSHAIQVISDVLNKLLTVGIADPGIYLLPVTMQNCLIYAFGDASIRKVVLSSLHSGFDKHLVFTSESESCIMFIVRDLGSSGKRPIFVYRIE
jgi:FKBP12-rapamycin complex-associated protein